jgi:uncharacterized protein (TIRG00374 family)
MTASVTQSTSGAFKVKRPQRLLLVAGLIATLAIPFLLGGRTTLAAATNIAVDGYAALLGLVLASWMARALKLHLLLHRLKTPTTIARSFGISLATDLAFAATPAGIGGYVATIYYLRRAGTSTTGAATIMAMDQGTDLVFFSISVPLVALALAGSDLSQTMTIAALGTAAVTLIFLATIWLARRKILAFVFAPNRLLERSSYLRRAQHALRTFVTGSRTYVSLIIAAGPMFFLWMLGLTAVQWLTRYGVLWLTLLLLHHPVSFALTFLLQVGVLHAALWTGIPAGGGGAELGLTATLAPWVAPAQMATALVIWRAATLYTSLLAGSVAMIALARATPRVVAVHPPG